MEKNWANDGSKCTSHSCLPQSASKVSSDENNTITENNIEQQDYTNKLPDEVLELILQSLESAEDFYSLGSVNKKWWQNYESSKGKFLASLPPIVVLISPDANRAYYLYDLSSGRTKKVMLPKLIGKNCIGISAGYIILEGRKQIELLNPFTKHELYFPNIPSAMDEIPYHQRIILATTTPSESFVLVCITSSKNLQVYQCNDNDWQVFSYACHVGFFTDIAITNGKIYAVTNYGQIWELTLGNSGFNRLELKNTPAVNSCELKLVVSDDHQLIMVDFVPERQLRIYKLDFVEMEWVKMDSLGDKALFLGEQKGSAIKKPGKWGGRNDCVYRIEYFITICYVYSIEADLIDRFPIVANPVNSTLAPYCWYFQDSQSMKIESLQ